MSFAFTIFIAFASVPGRWLTSPTASGTAYTDANPQVLVARVGPSAAAIAFNRPNRGAKPQHTATNPSWEIGPGDGGPWGIDPDRAHVRRARDIEDGQRLCRQASWQEHLGPFGKRQ